MTTGAEYIAALQGHPAITPSVACSDDAGSGSDDDFFESIGPKEKATKNPDGSIGGGGPDNTKKKRPSPGIHWLFTRNNPEDEEYEEVKKVLQEYCRRFAMQEEIGKKKGTPHFHFYVNLWPGFKERGLAFLKSKLPKLAGKTNVRGIRKGTHDRAARYCLKEDTHPVGSRRDSKKVLVPVVPTWVRFHQFFVWQQIARDMILACSRPRNLYWFWEKVGNVGKSAFIRHFEFEYECLQLGGAKKDMIYRVATWISENPGCVPEFTIIDLCRSASEDGGVALSWNGLEEIQNGGGFSGKYESCQWYLARPPRCTIVVANEPPPWHRLSHDRWKVYEIRDTELIYCEPTGPNVMGHSNNSWGATTLGSISMTNGKNGSSVSGFGTLSSL